MTTASKAIDRIAEITGILPSTVFRGARYIREADPNEWPKGTQGRNQEAHVEPRHLNNVVLAVAFADPLTSAPEVVARLRDMVPAPAGTPFLGNAGALVADGEQFLPGDTFGEAMDLYVSAAADPNDRARIEREHLRVTLCRRGENLIYASVCAIQCGADGTVKQVSCLYQPRDHKQQTDRGLIAPFDRQVEFDSRLILILGDLYADTLKHREKQRAKLPTKGEAPGSAEPETKNADVPGRKSASRA